MSACSDAEAGPMPRRAVSADARNGWMLLALLPGALLRGQAFGWDTLLPLLAAVVVAMLAEAGLAFAIRKRVSMAGLRETILFSALVALWLPPTVPAWAVAVAALAAVVPRRLLFGGAPSPFHPAMAGCAVAILCAARVDMPVGADAGFLLVAAAYAIGGVALAIGRCIRWQVPAMNLVLVVGWLAVLGWLGDGPPAYVALAPFLPTLVLTAFFIATDPGSGCLSMAARLRFAGFVGMFSVSALLVLRDDAHMLLGIAGTVLLANAVAPRLDLVFGRARDSGASRA